MIISYHKTDEEFLKKIYIGLEEIMQLNDHNDTTPELNR